MDNKNLVCLNDGSPTRISHRPKSNSVLDLTLVSQEIASMAIWQVNKDTTIGSDHYPTCKVGRGENSVTVSSIERWIFKTADWEKFKYFSKEGIKQVKLNEDIDKVNRDITEFIIEAAKQTIVEKCGRKNKRLVPWWTEECG